MPIAKASELPLMKNISYEYYLIRILFFIPILCVIAMLIVMLVAVPSGVGQSTRDLGIELRRVALQGATDGIDSYLSNIARIGHISYSAWTEGKINLTFSHKTRHLLESQANAKTIRDHLYNLVNDENSNGKVGPRAVYIANRDGCVINYEFINKDLSMLKERLVDVYSRYEIYANTNNTKGRLLLPQDATYNPNLRPWWNFAMASPPGGQNWTNVYRFASRGVLGITTVLKLGKSAALEDYEGAIAADITLSDLDSFLLNRLPTERSNLVLYERTGDIVAMSYKSFVRTPGSAVRMNYLNIPVPAFRAAGDFLHKQTDGFFSNLFGTPSTFEVEILRETWYLDITTIVRDDGIEWLLVMMVPEEDILGGGHSTVLRLTWICILITAAASVLLIIIMQTVLYPLYALKGRLDKQVRDIESREAAWKTE